MNTIRRYQVLVGALVVSQLITGIWLATVVGLCSALLPAVLLAGAVFVAARFWVRLVAPEPAAIAAAAAAAALSAVVIIGGELWCGMWWLGGRFERYDVTGEPRGQ